MMNVEFDTKPGEYVLYFQYARYTGKQIEHFGNKKHDFFEFLPGIFFKITNNKIQGCKSWVINFLDAYKGNLRTIRMIRNKLYERWMSIHVEVLCKNVRDTYFLCLINKGIETIICSNEKKYPEEPAIDIKKYKSSDRKPEYKMVKTADILFPDSSGGYGERCSLKGILGSLGIFSSFIDQEYAFLSEYEMHGVAAESTLLKELCMTCSKCKQTVESMKAGTFLGTTSENDSDGLHLGLYGDKYLIENGNHRTCCAKLFGIDEVKAHVSYYEICENEKDFREQRNYNTDEIYDNEKVLKSFYEKFLKYGIDCQKVKKYLEEDGTNLGLISMFEHELKKYKKNNER